MSKPSHKIPPFVALLCFFVMSYSLVLFYQFFVSNSSFYVHVISVTEGLDLDGFRCEDKGKNREVLFSSEACETLYSFSDKTRAPTPVSPHLFIYYALCVREATHLSNINFAFLNGAIQPTLKRHICFNFNV